MKITKLPVALMGLALGLASCEAPVTTTAVSSEVANLSYSIGASVAQNISKIPVKPQLSDMEKDVTKFVDGFKVGFGKDTAVFEAAQQIINDRLGPNVDLSKVGEMADQIAYNLGIVASGGLAIQMDLPASDFNLASVEEGFKAGLLTDGKTKFKAVEMDSIIKAYLEPRQKELQKKMMADRQKMKAEKMQKDFADATANKEAGLAFLIENAKKPGVKTTASGLQYEVLTKGSGAQATIDSKVKVHYHGTLINGTVFDSSVDRGTPAEFPVNGVIKGWQEGVPLMKVGAKYRLYIASNLAYGDRSAGPKIPAGSTLIFEVELLEIIE